MNRSERLQREKSFHDHRYGVDDSERRCVRRFYAVGRRREARYLEIVSRLCRGKRLLEIGCGNGSRSRQWLRSGARVTGIDISPEAIRVAREKTAHTANRAEFLVMNAEDMAFEDDRFDMVVGSGVLHHLHLATAYPELSRVCAPCGHLVFCEPLGHNPVINLYRRLTPNIRTRDEHPLTVREIRMLHRYFHEVKIEYFSLLILLAIPFRKMVFFEWLCKKLARADKVICRIPLVRRYAWMVLIQARDPRCISRL